MDKVISPKALCSISMPRKSFGFWNLHLKCLFNLFCNCLIASFVPAIKESSTYWRRKHSSSFEGLNRNRQGSIVHCFIPILINVSAEKS